MQKIDDGILKKLNDIGWVIVPDVLDSNLINRVIDNFTVALKKRDKIRLRNGVIDNNSGTLHHLVADNECYLDVIKKIEYFDNIIKTFLNTKNYILNTFGGMINTNNVKTYVHDIHKDIRFTGNEKFKLNILIMLDDFTNDNGATFLLPNSQKMSSVPDKEFFFKHANQAIGKKGSFLFFDSRLWHCAGENKTSSKRRALTITLTPPYFKQEFNYPESCEKKYPSLTNLFLRQIIGFNSRVPKNLSEYYVKTPDRMYKKGQDDFLV